VTLLIAAGNVAHHSVSVGCSPPPLLARVVFGGHRRRLLRRAVGPLTVLVNPVLRKNGRQDGRLHTPLTAMGHIDFFARPGWTACRYGFLRAVLDGRGNWLVRRMLAIAGNRGPAAGEPLAARP